MKRFIRGMGTWIIVLLIFYVAYANFGVGRSTVLKVVFLSVTFSYAAYGALSTPLFVGEYHPGRISEVIPSESIGIT